MQGVTCYLCGKHGLAYSTKREGKGIKPLIEKHHCTPQEIGGLSWYMRVCRPCHIRIHQNFSNLILAKLYNTPNRLKEAMSRL